METGGLKVKFSTKTKQTKCNCPMVGRSFEKKPKSGSQNRATLWMKTKDSSLSVFSQYYEALKNGSVTIYKLSTTQEEQWRTASENKRAGLNESPYCCVQWLMPHANMRVCVCVFCVRLAISGRKNMRVKVGEGSIREREREKKSKHSKNENKS